MVRRRTERRGGIDAGTPGSGQHDAVRGRSS
jgi:hypothetical protein